VAAQFFFVTLEPSLDNPLQLAQYARAVEALLRQLYPPYTGYTIQLLKQEGTKKKQWGIAVYHGWSSGVLVEIAPDRGMPHIAKISVSWHSRVKQLVHAIGMKLGSLLVLVYLLVGIFRAGIIALLIVGFPFFLVYALLVILAESLIAGAVSLIGGNNFNESKQTELLERLRQIPAPTAPGSKELAAAKFAGN
jgi:hypothetical protein